MERNPSVRSDAFLASAKSSEVLRRPRHNISEKLNNDTPFHFPTDADVQEASRIGTPLLVLHCSPSPLLETLAFVSLLLWNPQVPPRSCYINLKTTKREKKINYKKKEGRK